MTDASTVPAIEHHPERRRFTTRVDGHEAVLHYTREGDVLAITHTLVPAEIGGRGIAGALVQAALDHARAAGLRVDPVCSYAAGWMDRHPEYADLRA